MSQKITSKNLSYSHAPPPFLAALQAQASGQTGPDPIIASQRRAAKKRSGSEEAEDVPLVVDELGNVVDVEVDKDGTVREQQAKPEERKEKNASAGEADKKDEPDSGLTAGRKRKKIGKVVGGDAVDEAEKKREHGKNPKTKKARKIKLSFDEEG